MRRREPDLVGLGHVRRFAQLIANDSPNKLTPDELMGKWSAWQSRVDLATAKEYPAALPLWFVHAPGAHPMWQWHSVNAYHLRPIEGQPPAKLRHPNASHEFAIMALDPDWDVVVDPTHETRVSAHYLSPPNMIHQVCDLTDEQAGELLHLFVRALVDGLTSPDDDCRTHNAQLLEGTADHLRAGRHMPS